METLAVILEMIFIVAWIIFRFKIERKQDNTWLFGMLSTLSLVGVTALAYIDPDVIGRIVPLINVAVLFTPILLQSQKK